MVDIEKLIDMVGTSCDMILDFESTGKEIHKWYVEVFIGKWGGKFPEIETLTKQ